MKIKIISDVNPHIIIFIGNTPYLSSYIKIMEQLDNKINGLLGVTEGL